jgi:hypothetical protein
MHCSLVCVSYVTLVRKHFIFLIVPDIFTYLDPILGTSIYYSQTCPFAGQNEFMDFPGQTYVPRCGNFYVHARL